MNMMTGGMSVEQRDIVLIPFPHTDGTGIKKRPCLIISDNDYHKEYEDVIVCALTSNPKPTKYAIPIENSDLEKGPELRKKSSIRPDKLRTIKKTRITKKFGKVNIIKSKEVIEKIYEIIEIKE